MSEEAAQVVGEALPLSYHKIGRVGIVGHMPAPTGKGSIVVATGGTSDMPVAEEAALTAEVLGNKVTRLYDVGVAGLHRTLSHLEDIMSARVIIAIAGMEGALASVIGGLSDCPVIAVPTSVGYGAAFGGLAALLSMLNSCASGRQRGEHRQRLRRRVPGQYDQPPVTPARAGRRRRFMAAEPGERPASGAKPPPSPTPKNGGRMSPSEGAAKAAASPPKRKRVLNKGAAPQQRCVFPVLYFWICSGAHTLFRNLSRKGASL